ncbi:MAG: phosphoesterase, partial [Bacteroidetes bacterium]|nr:phosphoesterase [Bacteroidota bacterium]
MQKSSLSFMLFFTAIMVFSSCKKDPVQPVKPDTSDYSSEVVISWIELTLQLTKETPGYSPPVAARVYGYSGLALYESVRHGMPGYKSLEGQLTGFDPGTIPLVDENADYHWGAVANATLALFLKNCFQTA